MSHNGTTPMTDAGATLGTLFAAGTSWGAAVCEWITGAGLLNPASVIAAVGTLVGFVANYPKLRAGAPQLWSDLRVLARRMRGVRP